jgi:hypothetical protein
VVQFEAAAEHKRRLLQEEMATLAEDATGSLQEAIAAIAVRDARLAETRAASRTHALRVRWLAALVRVPGASVQRAGVSWVIDTLQPLGGCRVDYGVDERTRGR